MNKQLKKALISFAWRLGGMIAVVVLNELSKEMTSFGFSTATVGILSLATGELTKYINVNILQK